jgi:hypothetical protein
MCFLCSYSYSDGRNGGTFVVCAPKGASVFVENPKKHLVINKKNMWATLCRLENRAEDKQTRLPSNNSVGVRATHRTPLPVQQQVGTGTKA